MLSTGVAPGWMLSQTLRKTVRKIKDTAGRPIWTPSYDEGMAAGTPDMLLGYPVYINNDMPAPAANAKSLAFGNLQRYMIRDAMQVQLFRFDDSAFAAKGQVGFLAWARERNKACFDGCWDRGRRDVHSQFHGGGDLVDVLAARARGAHEALVDRKVVDGDHDPLTGRLTSLGGW